MKKMYLALAIAGLLAGCATQGNNAPSATPAKATATTAMATGDNLIVDPQISEFRANSGKSDVWVKDANKSEGLGDVGSSKVSAFQSDEGSARLRFVSANDDFSATPGLLQTVNGLSANTDYVFSLYFEDRKGAMSPTELIAGVEGIDGKVIEEKTVSAADLSDAPHADRKSFKQVTVAFNSGNNTSATVFAKLKLADKSALNMDGNIGKQTEVRVDGFSLTAK
ncbi:hypothetical protein [Vibrio sp. B1Z05]|uniref:hypothetical protein n=1 Tax=Vibrio sp. B1Z05 TaxID=2654980 RepID=UPI00128C5315|nr:hypothetical protein [Vibrio sp. B1Z05]MPW36689.1 hypothetical protein [Vibrio sp. B1Z05]